MNKLEKFVAGLIVIAILGGVAWFVVRERNKINEGGKTNKEVTANQPVDLEKLGQEYVNKVTELKNNYYQQETNLADSDNSGSWQGVLAKTRDDLLVLTLPAKYKSFHLQLVLSLNNLANALASEEEEAIASARDKLNKAWQLPQ